MPIALFGATSEKSHIFLERAAEYIRFLRNKDDLVAERFLRKCFVVDAIDKNVATARSNNTHEKITKCRFSTTVWSDDAYFFLFYV